MVSKVTVTLFQSIHSSIFIVSLFIFKLVFKRTYKPLSVLLRVAIISLDSSLLMSSCSLPESQTMRAASRLCSTLLPMGVA